MRPAELDDQPMISREEGSNTRRVAQAAMAKAGVRPRTVLELGSCKAVGAGLGFSLIRELEASASTRFRTLHFRDTRITSSDYVACLKSERMRRSIKAFFDVAAGPVQSARSDAARPPLRHCMARGIWCYSGHVQCSNSLHSFSVSSSPSVSAC